MLASHPSIKVSWWRFVYIVYIEAACEAMQSMTDFVAEVDGLSLVQQHRHHLRDIWCRERHIFQTFHFVFMVSGTLMKFVTAWEQGIINRSKIQSFLPYYASFFLDPDHLTKDASLIIQRPYLRTLRTSANEYAWEPLESVADISVTLIKDFSQFDCSSVATMFIEFLIGNALKGDTTQSI